MKKCWTLNKPLASMSCFHLPPGRLPWMAVLLNLVKVTASTHEHTCNNDIEADDVNVRSLNKITCNIPFLTMVDSGKFYIGKLQINYTIIKKFPQQNHRWYSLSDALGLGCRVFGQTCIAVLLPWIPVQNW